MKKFECTSPEMAHGIIDMCNGYADDEIVGMHGVKHYAQTWREIANDYLDNWEPN